jgi:hypothetical protein
MGTRTTNGLVTSYDLYVGETNGYWSYFDSSMDDSVHVDVNYISSNTNIPPPSGTNRLPSWDELSHISVPNYSCGTGIHDLIQVEYNQFSVIETLGTTSGIVYFDWYTDDYGSPYEIDVYYEGTIIASFNESSSSSGTHSFNWYHNSDNYVTVSFYRLLA